MKTKRITVEAASSLASVEGGQCDVVEFHETVKDAKARARYVLTEQFRRAGEMRYRLGYVRVMVAGQCVFDQLNEEGVETGPTVHLSCCCCGEGLIGRQWWNRDDGFGICTPCADKQAKRETAQTMVSCYGERGTHYAVQPSEDASAAVSGRTIWNSDGTDGPCLICFP